MAELPLEAIEGWLTERGAVFHTIYPDAPGAKVIRCRTSLAEFGRLESPAGPLVVFDERNGEYLAALCRRLEPLLEGDVAPWLERDSAFRVRAAVLCYLAERGLNRSRPTLHRSYGIVASPSSYLARVHLEMRNSDSVSGMLVGFGLFDAPLPAYAFLLAHECAHVGFASGERPSARLVQFMAVASQLLRTADGNGFSLPADADALVTGVADLSGASTWRERVWADASALEGLAKGVIEEAQGCGDTLDRKLRSVFKLALMTLLAQTLLAAARALVEGDRKKAGPATEALKTDVLLRVRFLKEVFKLLYGETVTVFAERVKGATIPYATDCWTEVDAFAVQTAAILDRYLALLPSLLTEAALAALKEEGARLALLDGLPEDDDLRIAAGRRLGWFDEG